MGNIILLTGNVKYKITLDPSVWIFDDRRIDLTTYFDNKQMKIDELEEYTKTISKHWDREIIEGAVYPPTIHTEKKFEKEKVLTGTFGVPFKPFLLNAEPLNDAKSVVIQCANGQIDVPLETAFDLILCFSNNGKPLTLDGPIHIYYEDGSNKDHPIKNVQGFMVK